jgi:hypothetical protein
MNGIDLMLQQVASLDKAKTDKALTEIQDHKDEALARLKGLYPALFSDPNIVTAVACAREWTNSICVILNDQYGLIVQGTSCGLTPSLFKVKPGQNYSVDPWVDLPVRRPSYLLKEGMTADDHAIKFKEMINYLEAN